MKQVIKSPGFPAVALLLILPAAYFISISLLKYGLNTPAPFDASWPFLQRLGISDDFGWNINLLILFGPFIGLLLALFQVLQLRWEINTHEFRLHITVRKKWFPILVGGFGISILSILFLYLFVENCVPGF